MANSDGGKPTRLLYELAATHTGRMFLKSNVYMPTYERYLEPFRGRNVTMLEIGIFGGGSLASFVQPTAGFINLVDVTELATLDGIDEDLAEAIVAHRATNGHFASPRTFKTSMA